MSIARITPSGEIIGNTAGCDTVLVPASKLSFFELELPTKSHSQARQIAGFSLEEKLAQDIEELHFSVQRQRNKKGNCWLVSVVSIELLESWLASLREKGIKPKRMLPDITAVSVNIDILEEPDQILIKNIHIDDTNQPSKEEQDDQTGTPAFIPCAISTPLFQPLLDSLSVSSQKLEKLRCFYSSDYNELLKTLSSINKNIINLIQGYGTQEMPLIPWLKPWATTWGVALTLLLTYSFSTWQTNQEIRQQIQLSTQNNLNLFKKNFPEITRVVNPKVQARNRFLEIEKIRKRNSGGLITLLNLSIPSLINHPNVTITSVRFSNFAMRLELHANQVATIEKVIQAMSAEKSLSVKTDSLGKRNGRAEAQVQIRKKL